MQHIRASSLLEAVQHTFFLRGLPAENALKVADVLVETSLHGIDTHGIRLLPYYVDLLQQGKAKSLPYIQTLEVSQAVRHLHADRALGPVVAMKAAQEALGLSKKFGVSSVAVKESNHFGSAGHYARHMAKKNCIGMAFSNADALVAPFAGKRPFFGTNPLAIAIPSEEGEVFCLDMATSQASFSQVMVRREHGAPLEQGWALDSTGQETLNASTSAALQPLGGYKGQGLAMAPLCQESCRLN